MRTIVKLEERNMSFSFEELMRDLDNGHETHFKYLGKEYSISHNSRGTYLSEFNGDYQSFTDHIELLKKGMIDGKYLKDIWNDVEVTIIF
ncbi:hypothetical protein OB236_15530 [Paenibacillus sp. WQ 127069]|uniref:Uncharacterized protein n=1 Tax=Paenibacillus baimaensis TaxID=2982185 RepID=A0ABT2UFW3_9BACL|nr:hypothetical protein [Paenibacillus sp. WQ 127069]MCU6793516.1 hypothetical protein [Paenibacillus sp. WQ 127069]